MEKLKRKIIEKRYEIAAVLLFAIIFIVMCAMNSHVYRDADGNFILATGRYIAEHGIPKTNPFCIVDGLDFVAQQWLWTLLCWRIYEVSGYIGIYFLCMVLYFLVMFVLYKLARLKNVDTRVYMVIAGLIFVWNNNHVSIRPTMITLLLLFLQVYVVERYRITKNKKLLFFLVAIGLLEINVHASLIWMHFVFMLPYLVPPIKNPIIGFQNWNQKSLKKETSPLLVGTFCMALTGLCNPYGLDGCLYLLRSYNKELNSLKIAELNPLQLNTSGTLLLLMIVAVMFCHYRKTEKNDSPGFYMLCGTTILASMHIRNGIYFYFGVLVSILDIIPRYDFSKIKRMMDTHYKKVIISLSFLLVYAVLLFVPDTIKRIGADTKDGAATPVYAADYLDNEKGNVKLFTTFNNGAYFQFRGYKTFVDARPELYFESFNGKADLMGECYHIVCEYNTPEEYQTFLDKYDFDYLCVAEKTGFRLYLEMTDAYEIAMETEEYTLWKKKEK